MGVGVVGGSRIITFWAPLQTVGRRSGDGLYTARAINLSVCACVCECVSEHIYEPVFSPCGSSLHHCRSCFSLLFCCAVVPGPTCNNETYRKLPGSGHLWLVVDRLPGSCFGWSKQTLVVLVGILIITTRTCNGVDIAFSPYPQPLPSKR